MRASRLRPTHRLPALGAALAALAAGCGSSSNPPPAACDTSNGSITVTHTGAINVDETWVGNGATHLIPNLLRINAPATVTVAPCAVVKLAAAAEIDIVGDSAGGRPAKLVAAGTDDATGFITSSPPSTAAPGDTCADTTSSPSSSSITSP